MLRQKGAGIDAGDGTETFLQLLAVKRCGLGPLGG